MQGLSYLAQVRDENFDTPQISMCKKRGKQMDKRSMCVK